MQKKPKKKHLTFFGKGDIVKRIAKKFLAKNLSKKAVYLTTQRNLFPPYLSLIKTLPFKMAK